MSDLAVEFAGLQAMHGSAVLLKEGGQPVALLPAFGFLAAGASRRMDLLLVPFNHSGYITRLFFAQQIDGRGSNWTQHRVAERNWWAPSWNDVPPTLKWTQMLSAHLRAVA
ncbi:hypothetical protein FJ872_02985 [Mesorhizobium sp. B2-5-9]|uniref:hypothetical protein n=1 Tax=unclassified Mesorhizobium TaxID=325217 RepID=UPI001128727B|nr:MULTISPECIES: hypothetical protein [unclassified Mesorhizobium]TPJ35910.1 hypothetical protein FJ432_28130 [Mesorhizobium sp. B2-6-5]TPK23952.1 hypothetical protein FJ872_02570 [Mesorhizobium sp. B2-5-9]TPK24020.1 hypothetical protein FJ872_02985 [Mesorhizobium sp. B2-5-9]